MSSRNLNKDIFLTFSLFASRKKKRQRKRNKSDILSRPIMVCVDVAICQCAFYYFLSLFPNLFDFATCRLISKEILVLFHPFVCSLETSKKG